MALIEAQFPDADRPTVEARCSAWLKRALDVKFGKVTEPPAPTAQESAARVAELLAKPVLSWAETKELFSLATPATEQDRQFTHSLLASIEETETLRLRDAAARGKGAA